MLAMLVMQLMEADVTENPPACRHMREMSTSYSCCSLAQSDATADIHIQPAC
jgi:hypothetical protein